MTLVNVFRGQGAYRYICQRVDRIGGIPVLSANERSGGANHEHDCEDASVK